jgi:DNA-binding beta-propeller fold protein YncE
MHATRDSLCLSRLFRLGRGGRVALIALTSHRGRRRSAIRAPIASVVVAPLLAVILPAVIASATPSAAQASEVYVAIGSPAELEVIDSTNGAEIGSAISLAHTPTAVAEFTASGSASSQALVAEDNAVQEVNPITETASSAVSLSSAPSAIAVGDVTTTEQYALVLEPSVDKVAVVNVKSFSVLGTVSLGFSSGSPNAIAFNPDGEYAYVTDSTSHQVVTLQYITTSPHFDVEGTYTGSSSFNPTSIAVDSPFDTILVSDGGNVDESSASPGTYGAPTSQIDIVCASGATAGALTVAGPGQAFVQELGTDYVGTVDLAGADLSNCMLSSFAPGAVAVTQDGGTLAVTETSGSTLDLPDLGHLGRHPRELGHARRHPGCGHPGDRPHPRLRGLRGREREERARHGGPDEPNRRPERHRRQAARCRRRQPRRPVRLCRQLRRQHRLGHPDRPHGHAV